MTPYTLDHAEADLRTALTFGTPEEIDHYAHLVDELEQATPRVPAPMAAAALWYAEQDLRVFPLQPGSKIPFKGTRGCNDATTDVDTIRAWWDANPDANIGLATGHLVDVVDIDGLTGQQSRVQNWAMFDALTVLGKVTTPRPGGMHLYVPATDLGNKAGLLPGVDYRSVGGYVVAPPSRTEQGAYRFLTPLDAAAMAVAA